MNILITGAYGFIGKNLSIFLEESGYNNITKVGRDYPIDDLERAVIETDFIFHLAGVNRSNNDNDFKASNIDFLKKIIDTLLQHKKNTPIVLTSSTQVSSSNIYATTKLSAEQLVSDYVKTTNSTSCIYRLNNVFGKWCKPNYNSVVATFCYNIINDIEINIHDPNSEITLIYIDDVCNSLVSKMKAILYSDKPNTNNCLLEDIHPKYNTTVGELACQISKFKNNSENLSIEAVGSGLIRCLYATFLSYYNPKQFTYNLKKHADSRGDFVEFLKTPSHGQFSFFTAYPNVTRGGHYHHTKNEKFLVLQGIAKFKFRHIYTNEFYEVDVSAEMCQVVETIPGWAHDISNIGEDILIVMLWANEIFNPEIPDTKAFKLINE